MEGKSHGFLKKLLRYLTILIEDVKTPEKMRKDYEPNYVKACENCETIPTVPISGLCGPCHWGAAKTIDGGWWDEKNCDLNWEIFK